MAAPVDAGSIYADVRIRLDKLSGDIAKVQTSLDKITKKANDTTRKSQSGFKKFFSFIKTSGIGSFLALGAVIAKTTKLINESIDAAADAQEVYSKFNTVFESIREEAEATADSFADSFGVAGSTARELLSATGDILVGFGFTEEAALSLSKQTNELAADLASFTNFEGGTARASAALTKALVGESESVKALGIVIRQDTAEYKALIREIMETENVTQIQAKALAALRISTEQSGKALGDFARTAESAANIEKRLAEQSKELKEEIGTSLLPVVTSIRKAFLNWKAALTEVIAEQNRLAEIDKDIEEGNATVGDRIERYEILIQRERERIRVAEESNKVSEAQLKKSREIADQNIRNFEEQIGQLKKIKEAEDERLEAIEEENKAKEEAAAREKARLEEEQKFTNERIRQQEILQEKFAKIAEQRKLFGDEFDDRAAREMAVRQALNEMIDFGFTAEGAGIGRILDQYGQYIEVIETLSDDQAELTANAVMALEQRNASQRKGVNLLKEEKIALEELIALYAGPLTSAITSFSQLAQVGNKNEIIAIDEKIAALEAEGESTEELEQQKRDLLLKNWRLNKAAQFSNAVINTAAAVADALPNIPLSILVGAAGTAQAVAIAAQQPPNLQTGGIILPEPGGRLVNVAENGSPELALNSGSEGEALLGQFADAISARIGGGGGNIVIQLGDGEIVFQEKIDSWYKNNQVLVDVSSVLVGVK
jgi:hypothetical protein